jgi:hypothetical protein
VSIARQEFCAALTGLREALKLDAVANAIAAHGNTSSATILRRGLLITGLVTLETFVRQRTDELLTDLAQWPGTFESLPDKFKVQALIEAPNRLHRYAKILKRGGEDFQSEVKSELIRMSKTSGPNFGFSKYIAGDYTGNLSEDGFKELLSCFLIKDPWNDFHGLSSEIGFGAPSIQVILNNVIQRRHKSAHDQSYIPAATDISGLDENVLILALCFDIAMTTSKNLALKGSWNVDKINWRSVCDIFLIDRVKNQYKVGRPNGKRSLKIEHSEAGARTFIASQKSHHTKLMVLKDQAGRPESWTIM